jgi:hypothetical protein
LDQDLSPISTINTSVHVLKVRIVDVTSAVSQAGRTRADVRPVVVVLGDMKMSGILSGVVVAVANQRCLPVVMEIGVRDSDPFGCMGDLGSC